MDLDLEKTMDALDLNGLPEEFRNSLIAIGELDAKVENLNKEAGKKEISLLLENKELSQEERAERIAEIRTCYSDALKLADEKVDLARKMRALAEEKIRELDVSIASARMKYQLARQSGEDQRRLRKIKQAEEVEKYCKCRQGFHGEMIACDAEGCDIEWYHLGCVGLLKAPKGNWYCQSCINKGNNKFPKKDTNSKRGPRD